MSTPPHHLVSTDQPGGDDSDRVVEHSSQVLQRQSQSFPLASLFLASKRRDDAAVLYALCRLIDDVADEARHPGQATDELQRLDAELRRRQPPRPLVRHFLAMADRRQLKLDYIFELIRGVQSDLQAVRSEDDDELLRYCYRVAGTVGAMMCAVLDVDDPRGRAHAIDLGIGMQLTNICRDVGEDTRRNRVYIPAERLRDIGVTQKQLVDGDVCGTTLAPVIDDLLDLADSYYDSADAGMRYIPIRSRLAIVVASRLYRAIGVRIRRRRIDVTADPDDVPAPIRTFWVAVAIVAWMRLSLVAFRDREHHSRLHRPIRGLPGTSPS